MCKQRRHNTIDPHTLTPRVIYSHDALIHQPHGSCRMGGRTAAAGASRSTVVDTGSALAAAPLDDRACARRDVVTADASCKSTSRM